MLGGHLATSSGQNGQKQQLLVAMVATTYSCGVILLHVNSSLI